MGEIVPVDLTFTSSEHKKYTIGIVECAPPHVYAYHVQPQTFTERVTDYDAAEMLTDMTCNGVLGEIDPGEKPFMVHQLLNDRFRMETPGKYRISVTTSRVGIPLTSNEGGSGVAP